MQARLLQRGCRWCAWERAAADAFGVVEACPGAAGSPRAEAAAGWTVSGAEAFVAGGFVVHDAAAAAAAAGPPGLPEAFATGYCFVGD